MDDLDLLDNPLFQRRADEENGNAIVRKKNTSEKEPNRGLLISQQLPNSKFFLSQGYEVKALIMQTSVEDHTDQLTDKSAYHKSAQWLAEKIESTKRKTMDLL